jgi:hypothetical protein
MSYWSKQPASRLGRSLATAITSGTVLQQTTNFGPQTYQIRVSSTLPLWLTFTSTAATPNTDHFLPANVVDYLPAHQDRRLRLSAQAPQAATLGFPR